MVTLVSLILLALGIFIADTQLVVAILIDKGCVLACVTVQPACTFEDTTIFSSSLYHL
jgi:hypothetical protein